MKIDAQKLIVGLLGLIVGMLAWFLVEVYDAGKRNDERLDQMSMDVAVIKAKVEVLAGGNPLEEEAP